MTRRFAVLALALFAPASLWAQGDGRFSERLKDFGTVPKGPLLVHYFRVANPSDQPMQVGGVRVSCGCVTASAVHNVIPPGGASAIYAQMDTRRFTGPRTVTIYVTLLSPRVEEVALQVTANTRLDLMINPDTLAFGRIAQGKPATSSVRVSFFGDPNFRILRAGTESGLLAVEAKPAASQAGEVAFDIVATAKPQTPAGNWVADAFLETATMGRLRVPVTLEVVPALTANPPALGLGTLAAGQSVDQRVTLTGAAPFRVLEVSGGDATVKAVAGDGSQDARAEHTVLISVAPGAAGKVSRTIKVKTDVPGMAEVSIPVEAEVTPEK